jgi:hypothetical protein
MHNGKAVTDPFAHRNVVTDKQERHPIFSLQPRHQISNLAGNANIERRDRFVDDNQGRPNR